jgi:hypothetical protein
MHAPAHCAIIAHEPVLNGFAMLAAEGTDVALNHRFWYVYQAQID